MNFQDFEFKKQCQATHKRVCHLIKKEKMEEAAILIREIEERAKQWEDYERSIQLRSRLMRHLLADLSGKKRIKTAQLQKKQGAK